MWSWPWLNIRESNIYYSARKPRIDFAFFFPLFIIFLIIFGYERKKKKKHKKINHLFDSNLFTYWQFYFSMGKLCKKCGIIFFFIFIFALRQWRKNQCSKCFLYCEIEGWKENFQIFKKKILFHSSSSSSSFKLNLGCFFLLNRNSINIRTLSSSSSLSTTVDSISIGFQI